MHNKIWMKPALIVLVQGKAEEAILVTCKYIAPAGPAQAATGCWLVPDCVACTANSSS